jgi:hypothetical protein
VGGLPAAKPERISEHWKLTVTFVLFQPLALGGGVREPVIAGGVLSIFMPLTVAEAEFPARSKHVPGTDCPAPSVARTVGAGGLPAASPERLSAHEKLTVTLVLFQPFALAAGAREPVIDCGVLSIRIVNVFTASRLPALSMLKNVITVIPSVPITKEARLPLTVVLGIVCAPALL